MTSVKFKSWCEWTELTSSCCGSREGSAQENGDGCEYGLHLGYLLLCSGYLELMWKKCCDGVMATFISTEVLVLGIFRPCSLV